MKDIHPAIKIIGALLLLGALVMFLLGAAFVNAGILHVSVHEKGPGGTRLSFPVPMALVQAGLSFVPDDELEEVCAELEPWLPVIEVAISELHRIPDGPLVEVESRDETVRIVKEGNDLIVDVKNDDEEVYLSIPLKGIDGVIDKIGCTGRFI